MSGTVCVVGSLVFDLVARTPRRPKPGESVIGTAFEMHLGGKGFNQAVAASRSGASVALVGNVGSDDFGHRFLAHLSHEDIDCSQVAMVPELTTGIGLPVIEEETGENAIIMVPGANAALTPAHVEAAAQVITAARVLSLQLEVPLDASMAAAALARSAGVCTVLNPAPACELPAEIAGLIDVLVPNETEAETLSGVPAALDRGLAAAGALLDRYGVGAVVMTLGHDGAVAVTRDGCWRVPAHAVEVVDTVAAGDAFCGALAAALAGGAPLRDAVVRANAAGALACTRRGAEPSMPSASEIDALLSTPEQQCQATRRP